MAKVLQQEDVWFLNSANLPMTAMDIQTLSNGTVALAFGGTANQSGVIYTGIYDLAAGSLGPLATTVFPAAVSGGMTVVRDIELDAGKAGGMVATFHMLNSAVGPDSNFALLTQVYAGTEAVGAPRAVNPATPAQNTYDVFSTVTRADGSYLVFSSELGQGANLSNGILMTSFRANGTVIGTPKIVITDRFVTPPSGVEANPEAVSATFMANGHVGLVFKENIADGGSRVVFQEIKQNGGLVGGSEVLQASGAIGPQIVALTGGKMAAVWQSFDASAQSTVMAQLISQNGTPIGEAFQVSSAHTGSEISLDIVALGNGGFAVSWFNGSHPIGRIFDAAGRALGNDFALTDSSATFDFYWRSGLTASGDSLITFAAGTYTDRPGVILGEVYGLQSTVGVTWDGSAAGNAKTGQVKDDTFHGLDGNDTLKGNGGNDILDGGAAQDSLNGGDGRDVIIGGVGADTLTGGAGSDVFLFNAPGEGGDVITDFSVADGDKIAIDNVGFGRELFAGFFLPLMSITLSSGATTNAFATGFFFNTTTKVLSYDADGSGALARVDIATLQGVTSLTGFDMYLA